MSGVRLALLPLLLSGCFAVNDPSVHAPAPVEADEFCAAVAALVCGSLDCRSCPSRPDLPDDVRAICETNYSNFCRQSYGPVLADPRTGYDPEEAAVQLATGRLLLEQCDETFWDWVNRDDGLLAGFTGSVPTGGSCDPQFDEMNRIDTPRYFACQGTDVCLRAGEEWRCQNTLAEGTACYAGECDPGLTCVGHNAFDPMQTGVCGAQRAAAGEPCNEASDCASSSCQLYFNDGRCLDVDQAYCGLRGSCKTTSIVLGSDASGPIVEGGRCDSLAVCMSAEQAEAAGPSLFCDEVPVGSFCDGFERVCLGERGELDRNEAALLCAMSQLDPPVLVYCGPRPG